jgi:hypothetical protein
MVEVVEGRGLAMGDLGGCNRDRTQCRDTPATGHLTRCYRPRAGYDPGQRLCVTT